MTEQEAIKILELAKAEVEWEYPLDICIAIDKAIEVLGIDLSAPMHFTKEQSEWIKSYVILKRKEARAEAIEEVESKMISAYTVFKYGADITEARADAFDELRHWVKEQKNVN